MTTFEKILDQVTELPIDQQELLIDIITKRTAQIRGKELAITSQQALEEFKKGSLKPLTAEEAILELRSYLDTQPTGFLKNNAALWSSDDVS